jgi:hypothetical protein
VLLPQSLIYVRARQALRPRYFTHVQALVVVERIFMRAKLDVYFRRCVACARSDENHPHLNFLPRRFWKSHILHRCMFMSQLEIVSRPCNCVDPLLAQRDLHCVTLRIREGCHTQRSGSGVDCVSPVNTRASCHQLPRQLLQYMHSSLGMRTVIMKTRVGVDFDDRGDRNTSNMESTSYVACCRRKRPGNAHLSRLHRS